MPPFISFSTSYRELDSAVRRPMRRIGKRRKLADDCVRHAQMFFNRPDLDLASAKPGSFAIEPNAGMLERLRRDYDNTAAMIFGAAPTFEQILHSMQEIDADANRHS